MPGPNELMLYQDDDKLLCASPGGLYYYSESTDHFPPADDISEELRDGSAEIYRCVIDNHSRRWLSVVTNGKEKLLALEKSIDGYSQVFPELGSLPEMSIQALLADGDNIWIGGTEGLFRFDTQKVRNDAYHFSAFIRRVTAGEDSVLYDGAAYADSAETMSMQYAPITALLVEAVKEQQKTIASANKEIQFLSARIANLEALIQQLSNAKSVDSDDSGVSLK